MTELPPHSKNNRLSESVYRYRQELNDNIDKPLRYVSQHAEQIRQDFAKRVTQPTRASLGTSVKHEPKPTGFLKRHSKNAPFRLPDASETAAHRYTWNSMLEQASAKVSHRISLSRRKEWKVDWEAKNKKDLKKIENKRPDFKVDQPNGRRQLHEQTPETPRFRVKKNYGIVPNYIKKYRKLHSAMKKQNAADEQAAELIRNAKVRIIPEEERQQVLKELEARFRKTMRTFQGLSVVLDNQTKIKDRLLLEKELNEIEKTIDNVRSHKIIVVKNDQVACQ